MSFRLPAVIASFCHVQIVVIADCTSLQLSVVALSVLLPGVAYGDPGDGSAVIERSA